MSDFTTIEKEKIPIIPYDHRQSMKSIDRSLGNQICAKTAALVADPKTFAAACFYFLDALESGSNIDPKKFCQYLIDNNQSGPARFVLSVLINKNPTMVSAVLA